MEFELCKIDWVAISAIATFVMVIVTFLALHQNKKQLKELEWQWQEEHKARLEFSIDIHKRVCFLKMENTGKSVADIKKIEIDEKFLNEIPPNLKQKLLKSLCTYPLCVMPCNPKYYALSNTIIPDFKKIKLIPIKITITYSNGLIQKKEFTINDYDYIGHALTIKSNTEKTLEKIENHLKKINEKMNQTS